MGFDRKGKGVGRYGGMGLGIDALEREVMGWREEE